LDLLYLVRKCNMVLEENFDTFRNDLFSLDTADDPCVTRCGHMYCRSHITKVCLSLTNSFCWSQCAISGWREIVHATLVILLARQSSTSYPYSLAKNSLYSIPPHQLRHLMGVRLPQLSTPYIHRSQQIILPPDGRINQN